MSVACSRKNVPYIDQILKEVLRWHPAAPYGLPHMTTDKCEYRGTSWLASGSIH